MSDDIGRIPMPTITPSSTFPLKSDMGAGMSVEPEIKTQIFGSGNAEIEQRFMLGKALRSTCDGRRRNDGHLRLHPEKAGHRLQDPRGARLRSWPA
jgi:hypothetical protein